MAQNNMKGRCQRPRKYLVTAILRPQPPQLSHWCLPWVGSGGFRVCLHGYAGERHPARRSRQQRNADLLLESGDDARGRRLRHAHFPAGNGEATSRGDTSEELQR